MKQAVDYRRNSNVLAVTLLTSFDPVSCLSFFGDEPGVILARWALQAVAAGVDGLICSPEDLKSFKFNTKLQEIPKMTPGIRPAWSVKGDQSRIMTPAQALTAGVTWMVIGRPITQYAEGPVKAVERIVEEIGEAEATQTT